MYDIHEQTRAELIRLKEGTDFNWRQFAEYFGVPYRTLQDWYLGNRRMPDYLLRLMYYKLKMEKMVREEE